MKKRLLLRAFALTVGSALLVAVVLCAHIYYMMKPKPPGPATLVMARIDLHQQVSQAQAADITSWLYQQGGVDHVLVNPKTEIAIFTFYPIKASADAIVRLMKQSFDMPNARRFVPAAADLASSCPVAGNSISMRVYNFINNAIAK